MRHLLLVTSSLPMCTIFFDAYLPIDSYNDIFHSYSNMLRCCIGIVCYYKGS